MSTLGKRAILALLAGSFALLTGCTRHTKSEHYFLIATNTKVPYWQTAASGFTDAAAVDGVTAEMRGPDGFDPQAEVQEFRSAVASKPAGILISVADAKLMTPEIDAAIAAGVPVITVDSDAPDSHRLYFIGTNNLEAGRLGGNHLATALKGKGNVVFFTNPGQPNLNERLKGYKDVFAGYPGIKVADVFDIKGDSGNAMDKAREYLALTGAQRIDAMVCLESASGRDVAEAFKREHADGRILIAMDVDQGTLELVKDGTIDSTISQKPYTMGLLGLKALDDVYHYPVKSLGANYAIDPFAPFPAFIDTGVSLVDKTNVDAILTRVQAAGK
jgi:ribose transport system substrate-binding protein